MATHTAGGSTVAKSNESKKRLGRGLDSLMGMARPAPLAQVAVEPNADTAAQPKPAGGEAAGRFEIFTTCCVARGQCRIANGCY